MKLNPITDKNTIENIPKLNTNNTNKTLIKIVDKTSQLLPRCEALEEPQM